ncbi:MAG: FAD-dependent oxidoreductase [Alphaproteobacteria bacterium]|nr:FAD-dependent oxidoreductase [Rhodospirillaceae bacterium]MDG2480665.1 FAD-dependent oxidoreductase [Alphaproteobacteria bacterium]
MKFDHLFSSLQVGPVRLKNRIFSTGHMTMMPQDGKVTDDLIAYHEARASGGAGLIIVEGCRPHPSAVNMGQTIDASTDDCVEGLHQLANAVQRHGCKVFAQITHSGRCVLGSSDGSLPVAISASEAQDDVHRVRPRAMPAAMVKEIIASYVDAAERLQRAGLDGAEVLAGYGMLPSQFLNPSTNHRTDAYGGSAENRLRFLREILAGIRERVGPEFALGIRVTTEEKEVDGLTSELVLDALESLDRDGVLDFYDVGAGTAAGPAGQGHIVPPMILYTGYVPSTGATVKSRVSKPVFLGGGRINQPQQAEQILRNAEADMCGMTRAMICDPGMAEKARSGRLDDIRACIGCNQACIGHMEVGYVISCIQHPETGRERTYGKRASVEHVKKVLVAGGGPAGMKAAAVAAERGHDVTLCERSDRLGGQALLAQLLPQRSEFGGIVTNLAREMELAGVTVELGTEVTRSVIEERQPDVVIVATGATPFRPDVPGDEEGHVVDAWQVLRGEANVGSRVVIADWRCDWLGIGLAEKLARDGCHVRLAVNGMAPAERLQSYTRFKWAGDIDRLGVEVIPYARLYGLDADTVYLQHISGGHSMTCEDVDTLVLAVGHRQDNELGSALADYPGEAHFVGDCLAPRTAEEAVLEGLKVGNAI